MNNQIEIEEFEKLMEEMVNTPNTWNGVRMPGEKCMYEIESRKRYESEEIS